jgi:hypothetical protein
MPSGKAKTLLAKMRFLEWLSRRRDLTVEDLRLSMMLTSLWNENEGFAWPSVETMAKNMGRDQKSIRRQVDRIEKFGVFRVERQKRPGRSMVNRYYPRFDQVPEGAIYDLKKGDTSMPSFIDADPINERGASQAERGASYPEKGGTNMPPDPRKTLSEEKWNRSPAGASPGGDASPESISDDDANIGATLAIIESRLADGPASEDEQIAIEEYLEAICEQYPPHDGDGLGGWAYRLLTEPMEVEG